MDNYEDFEEPDQFYGIPIEHFHKKQLLDQLDKDDLPYLRTIVMCKMYDLLEERLTDLSLANSILDDCGRTNQ